MMIDWKEVELGYVAPYWNKKIESEKLNSENFISADNMISNRGGITASDYVPNSGKATSFFKNDILVSNIRPYFKKIWFAKIDGGCSNDVIVFHANSKLVDSRFLYYNLSKDDFFDFMMAGSNGTKMPRGNKKSIPQYKINLPPLPTQRKIATILSAYDDLIENNLKRIKLLEEKAQLTYEEWFVRMKFPVHENTPVDNETGLPVGWRKVKLGSLIEISSSKRIFLSDYVLEGIPFYRGKEIILKSKNEALNDVLYISTEKYKEIKLKFGAPKEGDILITAVGTLGYPYLVTQSDGDFYFKDGNLIWLKGSRKISSSYLISCFKNADFRSMLKSIAIGSSQKALTIISLKELKILNPPILVQTEYDKIVVPIFNAVENLQNQNRLLKEARDILLPRLMTGVIDVDELDIKTQNN